MQSFELRLPSPVITALVAMTMWGVSFIGSLLEVPALFRVSAAMLLSLVGGSDEYVRQVWLNYCCIHHIEKQVWHRYAA